ncbi:MAG: hypothetical protein E6X23_08075 [Mixta calida]|nr:hypothetical protein [Mixta calida]MDU4941480.1 hypothetical protein [Mixta calida]
MTVSIAGAGGRRAIFAICIVRTVTKPLYEATVIANDVAAGAA